MVDARLGSIIGSFISVIIVGAIIIIAIQFFAGLAFQKIAEMKGHTESKYFWWSFLFGPVGMMMVIALPDRKRVTTNELESINKKNEIRTSIIVSRPVEPVETEKAKPVYPKVEKSPVRPLIIDETSWSCPNCGTKQKNNRSVCFSCGTPFIKD